MRTIQFRGKVKKTRAENNIGKKPDDGTWVFGDLNYYNTSRPNIRYDISRSISVDAETVGQYTGMYDIKGKQIWEGDIIEATCLRANQDLGKTMRGYVCYDEMIAAFALMTIDGKHGGSLHSNNNDAALEVIGNIHDNRELLNQK